MRTLLEPYYGLPVNSDATAAWSFESGAGANVPDTTGNGYTAVDLFASIPTAASVWKPDETAGAKDLDGSSQVYVVSGNAGWKTATLGELTFECVFSTDSFVNQTLLVTGGNPASGASAENLQLWVRLRGAGHVRVVWEHGTGVDDTADFTDLSYAVFTPYYLAVRRRQTPGAATWECTAQLWDLNTGTYLEQTVTGLSAPDNGPTTPTIRIGAQGTTLSEFFDGKLDELAITPRYKTADAIRHAARGLLQYWSETALHASSELAQDCRVLIRDTSGVWYDTTDLFGYDFFRAATWGEDVDEQTSSANITLQREIYALSMSPLVGGAVGNLDLIALHRSIKIETRTLPLDTAQKPEWAWESVWEGLISQISFGGDEVRLFCTGRESALLKSYIPSTFLVTRRGDPSGIAVETEMQAILNEYDPNFFNPSYPTYLGEDGPPEIYTPTSPGWQIREWSQENMSVLEACTRLADMIAWAFRYRWDNDRWENRLTFHEVDPAPGSTDFTFGPDQYWAVPEAVIDSASIRNYCAVYYGNRAASVDTVGDLARASQVATDSTSISKYGFLPCEVSEASASLIDNATEALALATGVVNALSEPKVSVQISTPYRGFVQLGDYYAFSANQVVWDSTQNLAVVSYAHEVTEDGQMRTVISARGKPTARHKRWQQIFAEPGSAPRRNKLPPDAPSNVAVTPTQNGLLVEWDPVVANANRQYAYTEVHVGVTSGFTPSTSTLKASSRDNRAELVGLLPYISYYVKVIHRGSEGGIGTVSSTVTASGGPWNPLVKQVGFQSASLSNLSSQTFTTTTATLLTEIDVVSGVSGWPGYDFAENWSATNDRWTAKLDCKVKVRWRMTSDNPGGVDTSLLLHLYLNGAVVTPAQPNAFTSLTWTGGDTGSYTSDYATCYVDMSAADYLDLRARHNVFASGQSSRIVYLELEIIEVEY